MRYGLYGIRGIGLGGGLFMLLAGLVFIFLVVLCIIALIRYLRTNHKPFDHNADNTDSAMRILNERFARGEINEEEYAKKKAELRK